MQTYKENINMRKLILCLFLMVISVPAFADNTFIKDYRGYGYASKVQDIVNDTQIAADYGANTDGSPVYLGYAIVGKATSDDAWMIYKFTYDGNVQMLTKKTAYGTWDGRASLTYK